MLVSLASPASSAYLREKAAFWLGAQRGHEGLLALRQLVRSEQDGKLREKLAFDLSINSDPGATDDLVQLATSTLTAGFVVRLFSGWRRRQARKPSAL